MQSAITQDMPKARAGMDAYPGRHDRKIQTWAAEGAIKYGLAVVKGTTAKQVKVADVVGDAFRGFALHTLAMQENAASGGAQYPDKDSVNVMQYGEIWVPYTGTAPAADATLYVDVLINKGRVTTVSTNNMAAPLKAVESDTATGLCLVKFTAAV